DEQLRAFSFVNGKLFEEALPIAAFDAAMRDTLLDCCGLDWSAISPAIFGALFQSIMDAKARRNLGAHYTSEENILKLIKPLFLDDLWSEFERVRNNRNRLFDFHKRLRTLTFLDPACGCGNFLVISYRELRKLELEIDWEAVLPRERCTYILGNPPFGGSKLLSDKQRVEMRAVVGRIPNGGNLDYVAAWYVLAARYMKGMPIRAALVSTNSITQGEQPGILWSWLLGQGVKIAFAHRTFQWSNEARGVAAVHCVIVGFGYGEPVKRTIFDYDDIRGEPHAVAASNINPYLVDAPDITLPSRQRPICDVPEIGIGNKPIDDGNYLFTTEEREAFVSREPRAAGYFRPWVGADELINGYRRWCLYLRDASPVELRAMPEVLRRVEAVKAFRAASKSEPTQKLARVPTRFHVENIPRDRILVVPRHSSERRRVVPMGYFGPDTVVGDACLCIADAMPYHFGVLSSTMQNAWIRYTCGRLESRYRYSKDIVYNNFPWPAQPTDAQRHKIEGAAQGVLDARAAYPAASLADLYDPLTMPPNLVKAHQALDAAVDSAYGRKTFKSDAERVAFLFELYRKYTTLLPAPARARGRVSRRRGAPGT
ncbi:MAG: class I SAM-dependent DNA methyltransferase, partial [Betaproteobacteria bacterium]|nr:class I SAM-dependent DNA methyltransferase [Betaproteobacteria bacterium]